MAGDCLVTHTESRQSLLLLEGKKNTQTVENFIPNGKSVNLFHFLYF